MSTSIPPSGPPQPESSVPTAKALDPATRPAAAKLRAAAAKPAAALSIDAEDHEKAGGFSTSFILFNVVPSYLISFVVHFVAVIVLALMSVPQTPEPYQNTIVAAAPQEVEELTDFEEEIAPEMNLDTAAMTSETTSSVAVQATQNQVDTVMVMDTPSTDLEAAAIMVELQDFGERTAPKNELSKPIGAMAGTGMAGRSAAAKGEFNVVAEGGSAASEKAVALALQWFADHQNADGSWNFDHRLSPRCAGKCSDPGKMTDCTTGATGLALLPFLGAGQTHRTGKYRQTVEKGLYYLSSRMKVKNGTGDLSEGGGNMYSHGIAAIVLCEGYAMTHDKGLMAPAQRALNHTMFAQDPVGGGWRYTPKQPGDTSAVGWQLMALKSGHMAYLQVSPVTIQGSMRFLDSVQAEGGAKYGYTGPGAGPATTAVGLLSRMYLGWKQDNPALQKGVEYLSKTGPSPGNMYFNYYATQVMRHAGGEAWDQWNTKMRDMLVASQSKTNHENGSWFVKGGDHGTEAGGRIYCTSMATMILEVYYRHMPIYGKQAAEEDFPL
jgi:hypothetical protein